MWPCRYVRRATEKLFAQMHEARAKRHAQRLEARASRRERSASPSSRRGFGVGRSGAGSTASVATGALATNGQKLSIIAEDTHSHSDVRATVIVLA